MMKLNCYLKDKVSYCMRISKYFHMKEFLVTHKNVILMPQPYHLKNIKFLVESVLEHIRYLFNCPIIIISGFRTKQLNRLIGGAKNSKHLTGNAADFYIKSDNQIIEPFYVAKIILQECTFGKLICYMDQKRFHIQSGTQCQILLKWNNSKNYYNVTQQIKSIT